MSKKIDPFYVQEDDYMEDIQPRLERALGLTREDMMKMSPEARNLFSARRKLGNTWLDDYEVVAEVVQVGTDCQCGIKVGQQMVFDMRHKVIPDLTSAPMCVHLMAPMLSIFYMTFDRAAEGLNPFTAVWRYQECPLTTEENFANKTRTRTWLRDRKTGAEVTDRILPAAREILQAAAKAAPAEVAN